MNTLQLCGALACLAAAPAVFAQAAQYSYISDRRFGGPDELMGYDFKPALRQVDGGQPEQIAVGQYSFGITRKNLYVEGPEIRGVYSVNNINTTEYGYKLLTMNARDPTVQGHLKVVVDELGQVEGLIFKRANKDEEVMFFLRVIEEEVAAAEERYFSDRGEVRVEHLDSLWTGVVVRPFLRVFHDMGGIQQRAVPGDSLSLQFYRVTTITETPTKSSLRATKEKKPKKGKGKNEGDATDEEALADGEALAGDDGADEEGPVDAAVVERLAAARLAAAKTRVTVLSTKVPLALDDDLADDDSADETPVNDSLPLDGFEGATATTHDLPASVDSVALDPVGLMVAAILDSTEYKVKIEVQYLIDLNQFMTFDDGKKEMQHRTYLVNGIAERENTNARPGGNRFQWELNIDKQPEAYVYLDELYNVNSIVIDGQKFYMRGQ